MSEQRAEGHTIRNAGSVEGHATNILNQQACETNLLNARFPETESNGNSMNRNLLNRTKTQAGKAERVVQDEPGVYLTLFTLPGGGNELKRVRFRYVFPLLFPSW